MDVYLTARISGIVSSCCAYCAQRSLVSSSINSEISLICVREADHFTLVFHRCCPYILRYDLAPPRNRAGIARGDRGHAGNIEVHFRVEWGYLSNRSGIDRVVFLSSRWDGPSSRILQYIIFRSAGDHFGIDKSNPTPPGISVYRTETSSSAVGVDESFMFAAYTRKKKAFFSHTAYHRWSECLPTENESRPYWNF